MRTRNVQILFCLTVEEAEHLNILVKRTGRTRSSFLRAMIKGYQLCEKPDTEFFKAMGEISKIGHNVNQLAAKANTLGFIDVKMFTEEAKNLQQLQLDIRKHFLIPKKNSSEVN